MSASAAEAAQDRTRAPGLAYCELCRFISRLLICLTGSVLVLF